MGRLEDLQCLAKVVDSGSFSAAARALGTSKSAVSKQIGRLESELGLRLLHRSTRSLSLSAAGHAVHAQGLRVIEAAQALEAESAGQSSQPRGLLRLSTSTAFGNLQFTALLAEFCQRYPQLQVVLGLNDRYVDLAEEGFDLVLRLTSQPAPGLVARRLAEIRYVLCAAPDYLARMGRPETVAELAAHRCLRFGYLHSPERWTFAHARQGEQSVAVQGALRFESGLTVNSSESLRVAALAGMGLAILPTYAIGPDLRAGRLQALLPDWRPVGGLAEADTLYAVYLPSRFPAPKLRALIDFMLEKMGEVAPWDR
ncbi:DNA-binding transcriptional LysR family regulator [Paucibacter oligotrophus]|uniref:DNA-binding transcriptional LysR family regulator n=1 Tax=Roseateles oligotrophus TaxID=1769250 RepID=A0A840L5W3_9BURK|nr:LysR family transcriptional regulator [Roseateles oligotrophus]MBB4843954.1 DNA-binding transcriptional LysR family regulator [Roseateles oligotrophus]